MMGAMAVMVLACTCMSTGTIPAETPTPALAPTPTPHAVVSMGWKERHPQPQVEDGCGCRCRCPIPTPTPVPAPTPFIYDPCSNSLRFQWQDNSPPLPATFGTLNYTTPGSDLPCRVYRNGKPVRSQARLNLFKRATNHPHGWRGHVIDHIIPLACGGCDVPSNMQWQTVEEAKRKDRWERNGGGCR